MKTQVVCLARLTTSHRGLFAVLFAAVAIASACCIRIKPTFSVLHWGHNGYFLMNRNNGQSHLALGGIAANILIGGRGGRISRQYRTLPSFYRLSLVTIPLTVMIWLQISIQIDWGFWPQISPSRRGPRSLSNTVLLRITWVSLPNGISFHPAALAGCSSVSDSRTDRLRWQSPLFVEIVKRIVYHRHLHIPAIHYRWTTRLWQVNQSHSQGQPSLLMKIHSRLETLHFSQPTP